MEPDFSIMQPSCITGAAVTHFAEYAKVSHQVDVVSPFTITQEEGYNQDFLPPVSLAAE